MAVKKINRKNGKKPIRKSRFNRAYTYSVVDGGKYISYADGSRENRDGSIKPNGYIPNTKENRAKIITLKGKADRFDNRLIWW